MSYLFTVKEDHLFLKMWATFIKIEKGKNS